MKLSRLAIITVFSLFIGVTALSAQAISGRVCDYRKSTEKESVGIPGVLVSVVQGEKTIATQTTGLNGSYTFDDIPKGVPLSIKFDLAGYLRRPTFKLVKIEKTVLILNIALLKETDLGSSALVADRLRERLTRKGADYTAEVAILDEFGVAESRREEILAQARMPPDSGVRTADNKLRIAVLEFKNKADNSWWYHGGAEAAQDVFVAELVKSGKFRVVERKKLEALIKEKGLSLSGDIEPSTAVRIGKLLGVDYLLTGAVTEYGATQVSSVGGGLFTGKKKFVAALNARLIDTSTGEVAWADEAIQEERSVRVSVFGVGGVVDDDRMFDKVMKPSIQKLVASLKAANLK